MSPSTLHRGEIEMQRRRGVLEAGGRVAAMIRSAVPPVAARFLEQRPFVVAAILDREQRPWAALWAGHPGFLEIPDEQTVRLPYSALDALTREKLGPDGGARGAVGLLGLDPETRRRMRLNGRLRRVSDSLEIQAAEVFSNCPKHIQKRILEWHDDAPGAPARGLELDDRQRRLVSRADTFFIATHAPTRDGASGSEPGGADASHRGGRAGFVRWIDDSTLEFPDYAGNNLFNTLGNLLLDDRVGLAFVDFETGDALHLTGRAVVVDEDPSDSSHPGSAGTLVRVEIDEWFEQARALPWRGPVVEPSPFDPPLQLQ